MPTYDRDSSDDDSSDEIGFPKTPGQVLATHHSDDNSDNESNKSSSASSDSDSEQSENENAKQQKSDSENGKKSASGESDHDNNSGASDSESDDEISKPIPSNSNSPQEVEDNNERDSDSSSDDEINDKKASSDSDNDVAGVSRERKRKLALDSSDDSDLDQGEPKDKNTTAHDLFGELSDDEENKSDQEDRNENSRKRARIDDDGDDEEFPPAEKDVMNDIFGEDEDLEEGDKDKDIVMEEDNDEEAPLPERRIEVEIPRIMSNLGNDVHFVKLPNFLSIDTHPYDPLTYEDEIDEDEVHDDEGRARLKLKVENTIRWRNVANEDGSSTKESNGRVVKWSDGSMSLLLGDEIFDIQTLSLLPGENNHLYVRQGTGLQGQSVFRTKLTFRPFSTESFTHRKLTLSLADRSQKTQKICVLPSVGKDPEAHRSEMIKKEESKLKASILKESKQKRVKDRFFGRGPNSAYLENDEDDDESISISKIKNQYKRGPTFSGARSESESESDISDDSDTDIFEKKKPTEKKKIVESDED